MSSYGFIHLPSLLVFVRPQPSTAWNLARESVHLVTDAADFDEVGARLVSMPGDERQETVLRLTALTHEIRHFHDFLLTPYGNQLVRDAFWYSILTFGALTELSNGRHEGELFKVSLPVDPSSLPVYGQRLVAMRSAFHERARKGLSLMEASALHVQIHQADIDLGYLAAQALSGALRKMSTPYSEVLTELWRFQAALRMEDRDFASVALALTLTQLVDPTPGNIADVTEPLKKAVSGAEGQAAAALILSAAMATIEKVVCRAMSAAQRENEIFLEKLGKAVPQPLRDLVRPAFADFVVAAATLQNRFLHDPMLLLDPDRYLRGGLRELVTPFVYALPDGLTTLQVTDRSWQEKLSDPLTHVREYRVNGQTVFQLACVPGPALGYPLDEQAWKNFADGVAGSLVIAEGADREHPVEGMWMRKMEERWPILFTPFGRRAEWQVAPGGAIV